MTTLGVIAARGGSQGVPGKNLRPLLGVPVIARAVATMREAGVVERVVVSTDSPAIADAARAAGAEIPFLRPAELARSKTGKFQVWQHALAACEAHYGEVYDTYLDIDCTNPLIQPADVCAAVAIFEARRACGVDAVFTVACARRNPYFNLVEPDASGALRMSKSLGATVLARQAAPPVFEHVAGVYVLAADYLLRASHLLDGRAEGFEIPEEKAFDIDGELDFVLIEHLLRRRLADEPGTAHA
ncbi:acylneuraminate cytidylyltransferase family protein [Aurantimonas sp. C2-6-R+9]|uniref:acylneuraminate cytidylyltransferase family protein n=1 Tax=unclassified Aurantimonas TaxID=2638230 RepID=UPI002E17E828|nr:acylneuraminate cytidylyltransferase family protein [Aurantimonas sp. C2-6-R+9]